jgi:hypothetical protein
MVERIDVVVVGIGAPNDFVQVVRSKVRGRLVFPRRKSRIVRRWRSHMTGADSHCRFCFALEWERLHVTIVTVRRARD